MTMSRLQRESRVAELKQMDTQAKPSSSTARRSRPKVRKVWNDHTEELARHQDPRGVPSGKYAIERGDGPPSTVKDRKEDRGCTCLCTPLVIKQCVPWSA
jgi:hypothetical protein